MSDHLFTRDHEWVTSSADIHRIGITTYAAESLGDVVYVQLPAVGARVEHGRACGELESTKAISDLIAPISGVVIDVNEVAIENPSIVNQDPEGIGWLFTVRSAGPLPALLTRDEYLDLVRGAR